MTKVTGCYSRMEIARFQPPDNSVLISITDPEPVNPAVIWGTWYNIFRISFWDVDKDLPKYGYTKPTPDVITAIHDYIKRHKDSNIFIHCEQGISRSAAVREYLIKRGWEYYMGQGMRMVIPNNYILRGLEKLDFNTKV